MTRISPAAVLSTAVCVFGLAQAGCKDNPAGPDAVVQPDAPPCLVPTAGYGTLAFDSTRAVRVHDGAGKETVAWLGALQAGPMTDVLDIQLIEGHGAFAGGLPAPGTFVLSGAETQLATCGVCVVLQVGVPRQLIVAQSGTLVVDELGPTGTGRHRATLTDAVLARVSIDPVTNESTVLDDGCQTSIASASWDTPIN